ncbi:hypothetical protein AYO38_02305 [bacterium SCGC AG-212-C10]|nr:hypothetical protein AYO38_02305 [bacterium SCGC AG-212-C10]
MTIHLDDVETIARRFGEREAIDRESFPEESFAEMKEMRLMAAALPVALGGSGWSTADAAVAVERMAMHAPSCALMLAMPLGLSGIYGSDITPPEASRQTWLANRDLVTGWYRDGRWIAAANSEKGAGGAIENTKTTAALDADGAWRLSGEKILASGGKHADYFFSVAKLDASSLPGSKGFEMFLAETNAPGVNIRDDWDGLGMRSTESQSVGYESAPTAAMVAFPDFLGVVQPVSYFLSLFAAVPLGCTAALLRLLATPTPQSPALRLRFSESLMRYESARAYLLDTASRWRPGAGPAYGARAVRTKTYVAQESVRIAADLFALSGGRSYTRTSPAAHLLLDAFAGTSLRPPLALGLDQLVEGFGLGDLG